MTDRKDGTPPGNKLTRRSFIRIGGLVAAGCLIPATAWPMPKSGQVAERTLSFYNTHTGESCWGVYWSAGRYQPETLSLIDKVLRDHRTNEIKPIDRRLLDLLSTLTRRLDTDRTIHVVSGYRSSETNAMLNRHSHGVAANSYHLKGKAIDIRLPGRDLRSVRNAALDLKRGGVGYYADSGFVHLDTGPVRSW